MTEIKAPKPFPSAERPWIFLAGSIEMGTAEMWQRRITGLLSARTGTILNPRRDDWDATWDQSSQNTKFREQVEWELFAMEECDKILMYFSPGTKSPITLLELGLFAHDPKLVVCCPQGYWRKGNVDIVCRRYGVKQVETLEELVMETTANMTTLSTAIRAVTLALLVSLTCLTLQIGFLLNRTASDMGYAIQTLHGAALGI